ncbi:MAG: von Willebrand factor type A domain-containing protein [Candidatus Aminicenantes bacterium]|nr:von Willebrand factor type A domain-containing protein [Candidatus Aminicenantes bacterium]
MKKGMGIAAAVLLLLGLSFVAGQTGNSAIVSVEGTVVDVLGRPLAEVLVFALDEGTGKVFRTVSDAKGIYIFENLTPGRYTLRFGMQGFLTVESRNVFYDGKHPVKVDVILAAEGGTDKSKVLREETEVMEAEAKGGVVGGVMGGVRTQADRHPRMSDVAYAPPATHPPFNTEEYDRIFETGYLSALSNPLSTFSIDVDTASYANVRRFIKMNQLPPKDAIRIEEMINYFRYDYPLPGKEHPFSVFTEISDCPWNPDHRLVHIGLQGKTPDREALPPSNLVFLIDVSGSMNADNKLPLLKNAFTLLTQNLGPKDRVAIVVYAGAAGLVLPSTPGDRMDGILAAIDKLSAGGSTAGGAGIELAYKTASENFIKGGNNRIILATDGDFNIGTSSTGDLVRMIEEKRQRGIFLTICGFGMGNYKDGRMEQLADKGNGNYYYIDGLLEAKKVFLDDMRGTLFTIAKDVKIQVEFNPAKVKAYRLIGYENRMLKKEDFADDTKDAGEMGAGHTVTALYEIIPYGSKEEIPGVDELKYQETKISPEAFKTKELLTIKLRYKAPDGDTSKLIVQPLVDKYIVLSKTSLNFRFSAAVAAWGMILRDSEFKGQANLKDVLRWAREARGDDSFGYRAEFINLVELCSLIDQINR